MKKKRWLLPTNTNNLRMIIAQGLITSSDGFSKYYKDVIEQGNGWIPLFCNEIPDEDLSYAMSEDPKSLTTCIVEFDIKCISGPVKAIRQGELFNLELGTDPIADDLEIIFIPAPLPINCISKVIFHDKENLDEFKIDVENRSNVVLNNLKLQSTKADQKIFDIKSKEAGNDSALFNETQEDNKNTWSSQYISPCEKINYPKVYAFGGMLSLLFYFAKNGGASNALYGKVCDKLSHSIDSEDEELSLILDYFFKKAETVSTLSLKRKIYHGINEIAVERKDFKDAILAFLGNSKWEEGTATSRATALVKMLRDYENNVSKKTVTQQFEGAESELEKMLLMLFVREDSDAFIEYTTVSFTEEEYLIFAMMFGIRDKFIKMPVWLKKYQGLQDFMSIKMAEYAHLSIQSNIKFKSLNNPSTVWKFVSKKMHKKTIKILNLANCVETIMSKADFSVSGKDGKVTYSSFVEPVYKIREDKYFNKISSLKITDEIYNKLQ